jgi:hypothetical protein
VWTAKPSRIDERLAAPERPWSVIVAEPELQGKRRQPSHKQGVTGLSDQAEGLALESTWPLNAAQWSVP